jgi:hypothetical protein
MVRKQSSAQAISKPMPLEEDIQPGPRPLSEQREPPVEAIVPLELSSEEIRSQVAEAAYYRALQRGFAPGKELEDWLEAEMQTMARLGRPLERN